MVMELALRQVHAIPRSVSGCNATAASSSAWLQRDATADVAEAEAMLLLGVRKSRPPRPASAEESLRPPLDEGSELLLAR